MHGGTPADRVAPEAGQSRQIRRGVARGLEKGDAAALPEKYPEWSKILTRKERSAPAIQAPRPERPMQPNS
jgi:hypothetical protein